MNMQLILESLNNLRLDELRHVQAHVNDLVARLEAQGEQSTTEEESPSYQAYRAMKAQAPEDLGQK